MKELDHAHRVGHFEIRCNTLALRSGKLYRILNIWALPPQKSLRLKKGKCTRTLGPVLSISTEIARTTDYIADLLTSNT
ncbi:hypothetical protein BC937DRAFT_93664 [Endogone sp. FLAS-F59071]|nr:hypothetical protein BC937DRAFT_93664 [Endogone sp. FLAS-F59071]|eukprot:RUS23007.1 hypothetical protein BC937DRAFT_93664 [Endogone sp. FLAS-F59071]